jgi:hypothetical protein
MRNLKKEDLRKMANQYGDDFDDEYDDLLEKEIIKEVKDIRKGKHQKHGFKKEIY